MSTTKRPGTAVDDLVGALRERIVSGELPPGLRLSQQQLAEDMQVSRTPLREALQRLATEGLVVTQVNRGMVVAPAPLSDVEGSYALRLLVEPAIVSAVVGTVTEDDIERMTAALAAMERPGASTREFQAAHLDYHQVLLSRYPQQACELIRQLHTRINRHQRIYFSRPPAVADFTWLDRIFLDAVRDRDGDLARHLLEFHLLDAAIGLVAEVEPEHRYDSLRVTLSGMGVEVEGLDRDDLRRPASLRWLRATPPGLPELKTSNLEYTGAG
ncbi:MULTISPECIES: GntR family transcriptional regulator [unclassified Geodermatophilus]|uniref:GntR family transcriptional regulator n=1 Tax=unclassified Geodermatophilus TaxID=2637632 RepID=UPI003EF08A42